MRRSWVLGFALLSFALGMCGRESSDRDDSDDGAAGGDAGSSGSNSGGASGSGLGGTSSGTNGEAGAAGEGNTSGGASGTSGAGGSAGGDAGSTGHGGECENPQAEVLILLDRSASMQDPVAPPGGTGTTPKWELTVAPLLDALENTPRLLWGLKTFPDGDGLVAACAAGSVSSGLDVPIEADNIDAIRQAMLATTPDGDGTTTGDSHRLAVADLLDLGTANPKFVVLVTDGAPNCTNVTPTSSGIEGQEQARPYAIQAIGDAHAAGIATFVLGVGADTELTRTTLDAMALAGGRPVPQVNPLETVFHAANDEAEVASAMRAIVASASLCDAPTDTSLPLPYTDDFETSGAGDWRFVTPNGWALTSDAGGDFLELQAASDAELSWAIGGDRNWTNVRVEMRVKFVTTDGMILLSPRWKDPDNLVFVEYEASDRPKLRQRSQGTTVDLVTAPSALTFAAGQWHTVAVTLNGTTATLAIDGAELGSATIPTPVPNGGIGISCDNGIVAIDDVRVTAP